MTSFPDATSRQPFITFNVWARGNQNIGHCSYTYGERESDGTKIWDKYHSIQPNWPVPIPLFPIPARAITELETDCKLEGTRTGPREPDRYTFPITHQQLNSIDEHVEQSRKEISAYERRYTYLPNCPLNGRVISSFSHLSYDDMPMPHEETKNQTNYSHCVKEVRAAQEILGLPVSPPNPWYIATPSSFRAEIEGVALRTPGAEIVKSNYRPTVEDKMNEIPP